MNPNWSIHLEEFHCIPFRNSVYPYSMGTHYFVDLTGKRFGRLLAIERIGKYGRKWKWKCLCDCGNYSVTIGTNLTGGKTKSCGCWRVDHCREKRLKHGMTNSRYYSMWLSMRERCYNIKNIGYKNYGGRGITVYWSEFEDFYKHVILEIGECPSRSHSLDRIDNDGDYAPGNLRWATAKEQNANKRNKRLEQFTTEELFKELHRRGELVYSHNWPARAM